MNSLRWLLLLRTLFVSLILLPTIGCRSGADSRIVVYCAHDREFVEDIFEQFHKQTGIEVVPVYDEEASKTVGIYDRLVREAKSPRCDVHWNNEILGTIRLQSQGVLQPYDSPSAAPYPAEAKAKDHTWTAFAQRARVIIVNTDKVKKDELPTSLWDLTKPQWKGKIAMAKPLAGTTATQAACLFQSWGKDKASDFYRKLHANGVELVPGNKPVAVGVGIGQYAMGLTDTDDAWAEVKAGKPVVMIFPDGETLFIPNTVALIKGCPNPAGAKKLIDFLLSPEVETTLANSDAKQIPLNPAVKVDLEPIKTPRTVKALPVDFPRAAQEWDESQAFLVKEFGLR